MIVTANLNPKSPYNSACPNTMLCPDNNNNNNSNVIGISPHI